MTRRATSPRLATRTFFSIVSQPPSEPHAPLSDPRSGYGGGGGDGHERGERHLYQVEDNERRNTLRQGYSEGQPRHHSEPGGPEGVDHGEADASPEQANPQRPPAGIAPRCVGGESRYGCGDGIGEQVPSRGTEDHTE